MIVSLLILVIALNAVYVVGRIFNSTLLGKTSLDHWSKY